jgi:HAD superfamily hydrolase (TIGR01509 family)
MKLQIATRKSQIPFAALFDWDGVVIDSSRQHEASWERLAREERKPLPPDHFKKGFGRKNEVIIPDLLGWTRDPAEIRRLSLRKEAIYRVIVRETGLAPLPGVRALLLALRRIGAPAAVGSSTHRLNIDEAIALFGLDGMFSAVVAAEDVSLGKPDPEVFLKAAEKLGAPPERCVVFEDAHAGIDAALAAGMKVVAVATTNPAESLGKAHRVVRTLEEITAAELAGWFVGKD